MFYDRKIKYLDYMENKERCKGAGYVKIEVRDQTCNITIQVIGLYGTDSFDREVFLLDEQKEEWLGKIQLKNGKGRLQLSGLQSSHIGQTGISYDRLMGIRIPIGANREVYCAWKEGDMAVLRDGHCAADTVKETIQGREGIQDRKDIQDREGIQDSGSTQDRKGIQDREGTQDSGSTQDRKGVQDKEGMQDSRSTQDRKGIQDREGTQDREDTQNKESKWNREDAIGTKKVKETELAKGAKPMTADIRNAEDMTDMRTVTCMEAAAGQETAANVKTAGSMIPIADNKMVKNVGAVEKVNRMSNKVILKNTEPMRLEENKWQQLSSIYPHIKPFHDDRDYISIGPADFVVLPEKYYRTVNNSFLLHGYYNYEHLILAKMQRRGETVYYIGVPGNFYEREKQVAIMFGFESFECMEEPAKQGDFGYYMMRLEL